MGWAREAGAEVEARPWRGGDGSGEGIETRLGEKW